MKYTPILTADQLIAGMKAFRSVELNLPPEIVEEGWSETDAATKKRYRTIVSAVWNAIQLESRPKHASEVDYGS